MLEVLPAAVLSFPRSFLHPEKASPQFGEVVSALKSGKNGPDFERISFEKFLEANRPIKNKKRTIVAERRIPKTFRLSPATIKILAERSRIAGTDHTAYIETLIKRDAGGL